MRNRSSNGRNGEKAVFAQLSVRLVLLLSILFLAGAWLIAHCSWCSMINDLSNIAYVLGRKLLRADDHNQSAQFGSIQGMVQHPGFLLRQAFSRTQSWCIDALIFRGPVESSAFSFWNVLNVCRFQDIVIAIVSIMTGHVGPHELWKYHSLASDLQIKQVANLAGLQQFEWEAGCKVHFSILSYVVQLGSPN